MQESNISQKQPGPTLMPQNFDNQFNKLFNEKENYNTKNGYQQNDFSYQAQNDR